MSLAKKATLNDANIKVLVWGESGSGKSRFALSSPNPIVVDLEGSTRLYAEDFDFYKAEVDPTNVQAANPATLTKNIIKEINNNEYPDRKTLVIDPLTDLLDCIENICAETYQKQIGKKITDLNAIQKTKWYAYRKETSRKILDNLKDIPMNLILVARSKNMWDTVDGKLQPVGQTYDCLEIVEYLMDIVINLEKTSEGIVAKVKKSRLANLPNILPVQNFNSIYKAIEETKASSKSNVDNNDVAINPDSIDSIRYAIEEKSKEKLTEDEVINSFNSEINVSVNAEDILKNAVGNVETPLSNTSSKFNYEDMKRLEAKHLEEQE